jgi:hypothetical protein
LAAECAEFFTQTAKMQREENDPPVRANRYLTRLERQQIAAQLLEETNMATGEPILAFGAIGRCAKKVGVKAPAISKFWKHMKENFAKGILTASPVKKKPSSSLLYCREEISQQISALPHHKRRTLRDMASELGIGKSTLHRVLRSERNADGARYIVPHTSSLLPLLTDEHKIARVEYALSKLDLERGVFNSFLQDVHIDEKWFEIAPNRTRVYLTADEKENNQVPVCKVIHKSHVPKVMFLAATARPRFNDDGECVFDGKIGIWPIVTRERAIRNSVNRPAGTLVTKPLNVNHEIYRQMLLEKVIPAIKDRFPHHRNRTVLIQQDGAGAHISPDDERFRDQLNQIQGKLCFFGWFYCCCCSTNSVFFPFPGLWNFKLVTQPARSPDLNHLDLSFFRALDRANSKKLFPADIDELIVNVEQTYWEFDARAIEKGFVTLGCICNEIVRFHGDNTYKLPHVGKDHMLQRDGYLPMEVRASEDVLEIARKWVSGREETEGMASV